jgi:predicted nucleic acid-binding protein
MFLDTNFLIDLASEVRARQVGPARTFLGRRRTGSPLVAVISLGELAAGLADNQTARDFLARFQMVSLKPEISLAAAEIDRSLIHQGLRLGENDNWIAGFCRYYGQPLVSRDTDFDRVPGLRRLAY